MSPAPFVSVVTPFYNTAGYLAAAIESVLAQTLRDFEYVLVDNKSTDGSADIARRYAAKDSRLRVVENEVFVGQVDNYNGALDRIDPGSKYVKIVQADDAIFPDCLRLVTEVAERDARIGIVGSLYLKGKDPWGGGLPYGTWRVPGRELCRKMLLGEAFPLGSPTTVLYRADIVRARRPFYSLGRYHEDTEAAYEILLEHDFGFAQQVLSYLRTDNESIMSAARAFNPVPLDYLITLEKYGRLVLSPAEFDALRAREWRSYRRFLGISMVRRRNKAFWDYHSKGLATIGRSVNRLELLPYAVEGVVRMALNPLGAIERLGKRGA